MAYPWIFSKKMTFPHCFHFTISAINPLTTEVEKKNILGLKKIKALKVNFEKKEIIDTIKDFSDEVLFARNF